MAGWPGFGERVSAGTGVVRRRVTVKLKNGKMVTGIHAGVCPDCGERYYDPQAMQKIESERETEPTPHQSV